MLWMPLNWSILFVSLVVAESRKARVDHEFLCARDKNKLLLSLLDYLQTRIKLQEIVGKEIQVNTEVSSDNNIR